MMNRKQKNDTEKLIKLLELNTGVLSLKVTETIYDAWASVTDENSMSWESCYTVQFELLFFFLHMLSRVAFMCGGGAKARATLQDAIVPEAISKMIKASLVGVSSKKGFDSEKWYSDTFIKEFKRTNEAEMDYGSCTDIVGEGLFDEKGTLGKLSKRISYLVGQEDNKSLRFTIERAAIEAWNKSNQTELVVKTCSMLR